MSGKNKFFERSHPITLFLYFIVNLILLMLLRYPIIVIVQTISLIILTKNINKSYMLILLLVTISNPIFVHKGATLIYDGQYIVITLEALIYGFISGLMIVNVLMLFSLMNKTLNSEHYIYLFSNHFPTMGLLISMVSQLIPRYIRQYSTIYTCQKQFYKENKVKQLLNTFSIETTWAFESSLDMLNSMNARGYGKKKRTHYHLFHFQKDDIVYCLVFTFLFIICIYAYLTEYKRFYYYPTIIFNSLNIVDYIYILLYALIIILPICYEVKKNDSY
jgi:energy-coupling factor transport system permease protein